jgi:hypothetical protein
VVLYKVLNKTMCKVFNNLQMDGESKSYEFRMIFIIEN